MASELRPYSRENADHAEVLLHRSGERTKVSARCDDLLLVFRPSGCCLREHLLNGLVERDGSERLGEMQIGPCRQRCSYVVL